MDSAFIRRFSMRNGASHGCLREVFGLSRSASSFIRCASVHLSSMDTERTAALGLEPLLTTSELADYLGVNVQAIYDLRCDRRGPAGIRVGRELRYRVADVLHWLEALEEIQPSAATLATSPAARGGER